MALRHNHYDAAFEAWLREARTPHVVVDEQRRSLLQHSSLKSMDFIVTSARGTNLLVDVKGRKFPSGGDQGTRRWENWATEDDLASLLKWQFVFGAGFRPVLVFAYDIVDPKHFAQFDARFEFRGRTYSFFGVWADEYQAAMKQRSASWTTVTLASAEFRRLRRPMAEFL